jgi:arginine utilization protein RocB
MMSAMLKRLTSGTCQQPVSTYSPDILPLMQSLLGALADIDFEFQKDRETILKSPIEEPLKQRAIATLVKGRRERRNPYLRELYKLEREIQKASA